MLGVGGWMFDVQRFALAILALPANPRKLADRPKKSRGAPLLAGAVLDSNEDQVEAKCVAAFVYQLPRGGHSKRGASGIGSGQFAPNYILQLPGARAACGSKDVVFNITREAGRCDSFATEENESGVSVTVRRVESGKQKSRPYLTAW